MTPSHQLKDRMALTDYQDTTMNITKSSFYPVNSLAGKSNFKEFYRVEPDGSIVKRVFLQVADPEEREKIIFLHYLRYRSKVFGLPTRLNITGRDAPWDFLIRFNDGITMNIEITSIADMNQHFVINKSEDRFLQLKQRAKIPFHELINLNRLFPDQSLETKISILKKLDTSKSELVENPIFNDALPVFISKMPISSVKLEELLLEAISKKSSKNHLEKEKTVLIIDNRTSCYEIQDYVKAAEHLSGYCQTLPFPEIWLYTGYYSDIDGKNSEFSFAPLKAGQEQIRKINQFFSGKETAYVTF